jgi:hypothetical protein
MRSVSAAKEETQASDRLTETIVDKLDNPSTSSDFDFHQGVNQVLADVGMSAADSDGKLTCYGQDPIIPSRIRFATMAGMGLAAKPLRPRRCGETERDRARTFMSTFAKPFDASAASSRGSGRP